MQDVLAARTEKSRAICRAISGHPAFLRSSLIAIFAPLPVEPDLTELERIAGGRFCYPRVAGEVLEFARVSQASELSPAPWNRQLREPSPSAPAVAAAEIGLILVPGLAFTRDGLRLGRGGGYYDRCLAGLPASVIKLGVCFEIQVVETLPAEPHDQRVQAIVTENGLSGST
jgi:5-formyltetrahydrofolate cyclo-ligase